MSNTRKGHSVSFDKWLQTPEKIRGFMSIYNDQAFDYDNSTMGYELGRQLGVLARQDGLRRSDLVRKRPKVDQYAFVKTKINRLLELAKLAGFFEGKFGKSSDLI